MPKETPEVESRALTQIEKRLAEHPVHGEAMLEAYRAAIAEFQYLDGVEIDFANPKAGVLASAGKRRGLKGEEHYAISFAPDFHERFPEEGEGTAHRSIRTQIFMDYLGIENPDEITDDILAQFTILHELGHINERLTTELSEQEMNERRQDAINSLPAYWQYPGLAEEAFEDGRPINDWFEANKLELANEGIYTIEHFIRELNEAYHAMPQEDYANKFAAHVLKKLL